MNFLTKNSWSWSRTRHAQPSKAGDDMDEEQKEGKGKGAQKTEEEAFITLISIAVNRSIAVHLSIDLDHGVMVMHHAY
jgi:hypothetical protein